MYKLRAKMTSSEYGVGVNVNNAGKNAKLDRNSEVAFRKLHKSEVVFLISAALLIIVMICGVILLSPSSTTTYSTECFDACKLTLVETIPENVTYPDGSPVHTDTYESWSMLINLASSGIDIGSYYWTLRGEDVIPDPSARKGEDIFEQLMDVGKTNSVSVRIAQNNNTEPNMMNDTEILMKAAAAEVRTLDFNKLQGAGILHTKMWIVDEKHFYVGSANLDWRALSQVKEMGIMVTDCSCMGTDIQKAFSVYWMLGESGAKIPDYWPPELATTINRETPMSLEMAGLNETMYISIAPPSFLPEGRTSDITALLDIIDNAQEFICIAVMDYSPTSLYMKNNVYWPVIDDRLRAAAFERGVKVRLMPSWWEHSREDAKDFLKSLEVLNPALKGSVEIKLFEVPIVTDAQAKIPYSRVNHNKYMVTETTAFIGTSNWSGDYFINTGGVSVIVSQKHGSVKSTENIHVQLKAVFDRDWNSPYAKAMDDVGI